MLEAIEHLEHEHRAMERIVRVIGVLADELTENRDIDDDILGDLCGFLRVYEHQCHHSKEESYLFPLLEEHGVPEEGCPIGSLRHEHQRAQVLIQKLANASAQYTTNIHAGHAPLLAVLRELAGFYPAHIWKEEYLLFPLARKVLSEQDDQRLLKEFSSVEADIFSRVHESYEQLATELEDRAVTASPKMRAATRRVA